MAQDRVIEKEFLQKCGVKIAEFLPIENLDDLRAGLKRFGKGVLKTRRFGYDGKGQHVFKKFDTMDDERLEMALDGLGFGKTNHGFVLEDLIDFESEFSIIGARALNGEVQIFDAASNIHENGILRRSLAPARFSAATTAEIARRQVRRDIGTIGLRGSDRG